MWVKLDDRFTEHPKIANLSLRAFHLHVAALCYAARNLTDGVIPRAQVAALDHWGNGDARDTLGRRKGHGNRHASTTLGVAELIRAGLWKESSVGYVIHDFLDYNPSRAQVLAEREAARERWRASGEVRRKFARTSGEAKTASPSPSRPDPKDKDVTATGEASATAGARSRPEGAARAGPEDPMSPISELLNPWTRYGTVDEIDATAGLATGTPIVMADATRAAPAARRRSRPPDSRTPEQKRAAFREQIAQLQQEPQAPTPGTNGKSHDPE